MASPLKIGPEGVPLSKVGQRHHFPWPDIDKCRWPGRELFWIWCHPGLSAVILCGFVAFIWLLVTS
jgi:hypothetical protein